MAEKRKASRGKSILPPAKRSRLSTQISHNVNAGEASPKTEQTSSQAEEEEEVTLLPNRVHENRPLPTLPSVQESGLEDSVYQSIEGSNTLALSLARSRRKWLSGEFFETYWIRTYGKKNQIANNPLRGWMKEVGPCTMIVEPMIFEATIYFSRDPSISTEAYTTSKVASENVKDMPKTVNAAKNIPAKISTQPLSQQTKPSTPNVPKPMDPVPRMLAVKAASDPALKELMVIVASGAAKTEQLEIFQKHVDNATAMVKAEKEAAAAAAVRASISNKLIKPDLIASTQSTGLNKSISSTSRPSLTTAGIATTKPKSVHTSPTTSLTTSLPILIEFTSPGASQDRFLFPSNSIVETLGSYSILASFFIIRKPRTNLSLNGLDIDSKAEYYEPVTIKIDVTPKNIEVLQFIKRGVKPQVQVQKYMEDVIRTKKRAPHRFLPLRLPIYNQLPDSEQDYEQEEKMNIVLVEEKKKRGPYKKRVSAIGAESIESSPAPSEVTSTAKDDKIDTEVKEDDSFADGRTRRGTRRHPRLDQVIAT